MKECKNFKELLLFNLQTLTNFPYIEKDFDALTNYELLCKVVEYLKLMAKNIDNQNTIITNLTNAFIELKDYVDNYFANLDVQDEINNKLDQMVSDGTFTRILTSYFDYITPEMFGAKGDGEHDDSDALIDCFNERKPVYLKGVYNYSKTFNIYNNVMGIGTLSKQETEEIISPIKVIGSFIKISGITFNYNDHVGRIMQIEDSNNIIIENCFFKNIGSLEDEYSNTAIRIYNSKQIDIKNSKFYNGKSSTMCSFIWISNDDNTKLSQHITVEGCYFEKLDPILDSDAVKVLGGNYNCYLYVTNCYFKDCAKRSMKFQGRECHSSYNTLEYNIKTQWPIDFQRGYGSSSHDTVIFNFDDIVENDRIVYEIISICQGYVSIDNLNVYYNGEDITSLQTNAKVVGLNSLSEYDNGQLKNITIKDINVYGGINFFFGIDSSVTSVDDITFENIFFNNSTFTDALFKLGSKTVRNLVLKNLTGISTYNGIFINATNMSNSYIDIDYDINTIFTTSQLKANNDYKNRSTEYNTSNIIKEGNKTIAFSKVNTNPSGSTSSSYSSLRGVPVGTIILCNTYVENNDNTYTIGYITTTTNESAVGTCVPIKIPIPTE